MTPRLARIRLFPVKSLDPVEVHEARIRGGAGLEHDREFRLADPQGRSLNSKLLGEKILRLRSEFDFAFSELTVRNGSETLQARLPQGTAEAESWFTEHLGVETRLEQDAERGFPDDPDASGPTIISRATLETVAGWFDLETEEMRRRIRANLEIDGAPAFWEDQLYGEEQPRPFSIGDVRLAGVNPCARCTVPGRDSRSGEPTPPGFAKTFAAKRRESLPDWAAQSRFDHYYRLAVNTRVPESENGKLLSIGDEIRL